MAQILIVDDEPDTVGLLVKVLALLGHQPIPANSCQEALDLLAKEAPDLVLLDLMMPEVDGYETLRRIRALPGGASTPVVVVTASNEVNLEEKVGLYGGNKVYHKPITIAMLEEAIQTFVGDRVESASEPKQTGVGRSR